LTNASPAGSAELFVEPVTFINLSNICKRKKFIALQSATGGEVDDDAPFLWLTAKLHSMLKQKTTE